MTHRHGSAKGRRRDEVAEKQAAAKETADDRRHPRVYAQSDANQALASADEVVQLGISRVDGKVRLRFVQDGPPANSDATGFDRVLNVKFVVPVRAEDILASIQESLDTID